jgi:excisionase family DNA binding protein
MTTHAPTLPPPLEVTVADAARQLGISERQVQRLAAAGELERVGDGRNMRIVYASIEAYHERRRSREVE